MKAVIVIPARFHSTRFPGKPLAMVRGKSLLDRTWSIAKAVQGVDEVYIATDHAEIERHASAFGARVIMVKAACANGTERIYRAIQQASLHPDVIINLQGDALLTPPWVIQALLEAMKRDAMIQCATLATRMSAAHGQWMQHAKETGAVGGTTVVFNLRGDALYFSKAMVPFRRDHHIDQLLYRHIGLYGYRYATLEQYVQLPATPLEQAEGLEQLRVLEHGIPMRVVTVDYRGRTHWAIDHQNDIAMVEQIIAREGELLPL